VKEPINRVQRQLKEWEKTLTNYSLNKRSIPRTDKELKQPKSKNDNNLIKKWVNDLNRHFSK
jgi:recombination DNA repair RAD52 pathway protein